MFEDLSFKEKIKLLPSIKKRDTADELGEIVISPLLNESNYSSNFENQATNDIEKEDLLVLSYGNTIAKNIDDWERINENTYIMACHLRETWPQMVNGLGFIFSPQDPRHR